MTTPAAFNDATINDVMSRYPATMEVFNAFGVDSCCGAHDTVREACARDGIDEAELVQALARVVAEGER